MYPTPLIEVIDYGNPKILYELSMDKKHRILLNEYTNVLTFYPVHGGVLSRHYARRLQGMPTEQTVGDLMHALLSTPGLDSDWPLDHGAPPSDVPFDPKTIAFPEEDDI